MKDQFIAVLDELALKVANEGAKETQDTHERIDALKALTAYYVARTKASKGVDESIPDRVSANFLASLGVTDGPTVPAPADRRRRRSNAPNGDEAA
jgi:hypothetical protein